VTQAMQSNETVSIVIPCYNQAQYLEESVLSAVNQTYEDTEIIIVNDGSPDNTQEVAEKLQKQYPDRIDVISQKNMGLPGARNSGIKKASGRYIVTLDADDILFDNFVEKSLDAIRQYNVDVVYAGYQGFGASDRVNMWTPFEQTYPLYMTPCGQLTLYRKKVWEANDGYKDNMKDGYEDWEFWVNAYKHGMAFKHIPEKLYFYRIKEESMVISARKKDAYLKSKIAMNHPELYPIPRIKRSIGIIRQTEDLKELYLYIPKKSKIDCSKIASTLIKNGCNAQTGRKLFVARDLEFELFPLEDLKSVDSLDDLLQNSEPETVFYSTVLYEVPKLKLCDTCIDKKQKIASVKGTIFPYVFRHTREDPIKQKIACERMENFEAYNQERIRVFIHREETLQQKYDALMQSIGNLSRVKSQKYLLEKLEQYQNLMATYNQYIPGRIEIVKQDDAI